MNLVVLTGICIATWSCAGVPVPPSEAKPFQGQALDPLRVGETTRNEVQALFGSGDQTFEEARFERDAVRVYSATSDTWSIFWCAVSPYGPGCGYLFPPIEKEYYLVLRFGDDDLLTRYDVSEFGCDTTAGFCATHLGRETMALASSPGFSEPDGDAGSANTCAVYLYTSGPFWTVPVLSVTFDNQHVGWLIDEPGYFRLVMNGGQHTLDISLNHGLSPRVQSVEATEVLTCNDGIEQYLYAKQKWSAMTAQPGRVKIERQSATEGKAEIGSRWRALFRDSQE